MGRRRKSRDPKYTYVTTELDEYKKLCDIMTILVAQLHNENCRFIKKVPYVSSVNLRKILTDLVDLCALMRIQTKKTYNERKSQRDVIHKDTRELKSKASTIKILSAAQETCNYCGRTMQMQNHRKWHGDRCKLNPNRVAKK
jgi:hypothetical protein